VKTQRPIISEVRDDEHRVLQFRPRNPAHPPGQRGHPGFQAPRDEDPQEPNDLSRYERAREEPDDFRHRMLANVAAFAFTVALTAVALHPGLRADGAARLRADCDAEFLAF
jgi:hypothetical protein